MQFTNIDFASMESIFIPLSVNVFYNWHRQVYCWCEDNQLYRSCPTVHYLWWYLLHQSILPKTNDSAMKSSGFHCSAWHHNFNRLYGYTSQGMDWEKLFWLWLHESLVANSIDSFPSQQILLNIKPERAACNFMIVHVVLVAFPHSISFLRCYPIIYLSNSYE